MGPIGGMLCFMSRDRARIQIADVVLLESGGIAQLAEHELCKLGVTGSIPVASTRLRFRPRSGLIAPSGFANTYRASVRGESPTESGV